MLYNITKNNIVSENLTIAKSFFQKFLGLMGKKSLGKSHGLMLIGCNGIHTCFMRFSIDVIYLNINHEVIFLKESVRPWRMVKFVKKGYMVVELPEGTIEHKKINIGDLLILK